MIETATVSLFPYGGGWAEEALLWMQTAHTPIFPPCCLISWGTLAKPAESSYPFATNENAGIFPSAGPRHSLTNLNCTSAAFLLLDVGGKIIWLFRYFSSFGFTRENTSERPALEFETLLEGTFNVILPNPGFSITPHKLTSDSVFAQDQHGSLGRFSHWLLN